MGWKTISVTGTEPITLADARLHCRIDANTEDTLLSAWIKAARESCEQILQRSLIERTIELAVDEFPEAGFRLPMSPVRSITSLVYVDTAGTSITMQPANYYLDTHQEPNWLLPAYALDEWPQTREQANAVRVTYVAGEVTVPEAIRSWMFMRIGDLYVNRESNVTGTIVTPLSFVDRLLDPYMLDVL